MIPVAWFVDISVHSNTYRRWNTVKHFVLIVNFLFLVLKAKIHKIHKVRVHTYIKKDFLWWYCHTPFMYLWLGKKTSSLLLGKFVIWHCYRNSLYILFGILSMGLDYFEFVYQWRIWRWICLSNLGKFVNFGFMTMILTYLLSSEMFLRKTRINFFQNETFCTLWLQQLIICSWLCHQEV